MKKQKECPFCKLRDSFYKKERFLKDWTKKKQIEENTKLLKPHALSLRKIIEVIAKSNTPISEDAKSCLRALKTSKSNGS